MKNSIRYIVCVMVAVGLLSGCGGEYAGMSKGNTASGSAVSGGAVSMGGTSGSPVSNHRFCTDTNLYYAENGSIMQMRLDGTHKTCIRDYGEYVSASIRYVDAYWLYYDTWEEGEYGCVLYRVPVHKDADGYDLVDKSKEEEIFKGYLIFPVYVDGQYYFFIDDDSKELVKYDLKDRRIVSKMADYRWNSSCILRVKDRYVAATGGGGLFVQPVDGTEWTGFSDFLADYQYEVSEFVVQNGQEVFYPEYPYQGREETDRRFRIRKYDGKRETDFLTWEQIKSVLEAEKAGLDFIQVDQLFCQEDRIYIQVQTGREEKGGYYEEYAILSQKKEGSGFRYERDITECMQSHVKSQTGKWINVCEEPEEIIVDHMVVNGARCIAIVNGKAYLSLYDHEKDQGCLGCYELETGRFQRIDRKDLIFYEIGYDHDLQRFETVFHRELGDELYDENEFTGDWGMPSKDVMECGEFMEDQG